MDKTWTLQAIVEQTKRKLEKGTRENKKKALRKGKRGDIGGSYDNFLCV